MIKKDDIQILKLLLKQTKTNKPFLEVSSKYRQLTGGHYSPEQIADALKEPIVEQTSML